MKKITDKTIFGVHNHPLSLDSGNTVKHFLTSAAKDFGRTSIAITDHGQLGAIIEADQVAKDLKKKGIDLTIVPGIELYLIPDDKEDVWELDKKGNKKFQYYHVTVHFEDFEAYLDGCKLSRAAFDRAKWKGGELKPMTTWSELESLSGKVTLTSSCLVGQVLKPFLIGKKEQSEYNFLRLKAIQGPGRFFSEIFPYEVSKNWNGKTKTFDPIQPTECCPSGKLQVDANNWIKHLSQKHSVPMVVSEDAHYAHESEKVIQDLRLSRGNEAGWKMSDANCLHTNEWLFTELTRIHPDWMSPKLFDEMVDNSHMALSNFKGFEQKFTHRLPIIENTDSFKGRNSIEQSVSWVMETVTKHAKIDLANPVYKDRLNHEIKQLAYNGKVNVLPYFMPLYTITQWCKENDVLVGPGRGSAAGSLLSYAIDITQVDPIKEGLSFERFFDVTRVEDGLADIDTDFSDKLKVVEFAKKHWGDKFAYLGIGTTFKTKSSLKDIDRFLYGEVRRETDYVCKTIAPSPQGISEEDFLKGFTTADGDYIEGELEVNKDLVGYLKKNPESAKLLLKMVGIVRQMSRHAAGVLIADKPIHEFIPVMTVSDEVTTQLLPKWVEKCGGVKYDLLGVSTLEDIRLALNNVKQTTGVVIDPWKIEDSPDFWEAVAEDSATIFQLHTDTVKPGLKKMRPENVEEASLLTSVFRPGAMDASANDPRDPNRTMADVFIDRWTGKERVKFTHPDLEPILKGSKAVIVYQEQLMQIAHQIGGLSMNDTNKLRRAISKKTGDELIRLLNQVREGMLSRGWTEEQADETIEQMKASGRYQFNLQHQKSYIYIARACAYLKYHYPAQWWAAVLTNASKEDLVGYWNSISKHVLPPDINSSSDQYQVKNADKINWQVVPPLNVIEGVGPAALGEILEKQPFSSVTDFMDRIDRRIVNKRVMLRLIFSGVLDRFFAPGADFLDKAQEYLNLKAKLEGKKTPEAIPEEYRDMTPLRRELMKKLVYKTYSTDFLRVQIPSLKTTGDLDIDVNTREMFFKSNGKRYELVNGKMAKRIIDGDDERTFQIAAYINDYKEHAYGPKKEKMMLKVGLEFEGIGLEIVQWPPWKKNLHGIQLPIDRAIAIVVLSKKPDRDPSVLEVKVLERVD